MSNSTRDTVDHSNSKEFVYYETCKQPRNVIGPLEPRDMWNACWVVAEWSGHTCFRKLSTFATELEYKLCSVEN